MTTFLFLAEPVMLAALVVTWGVSISHALWNHRPWHWVLFLIFFPVLAIIPYALNFRHRAGAAPATHGWFEETLSTQNELAEARELVEESPTPANREKLAEMLAKRGEFDEALQQLGALLEEHPEDLRAQFLAAHCLAESGKSERALPHLEYILDENRAMEGGEALALYGELLAELGRSEEAVDILNEAYTRYKRGDALVLRARVLRSLGLAPQARLELQEYLKAAGEIPGDDLANARPWIREAAQVLKEIEKEG